MFVMNTEKGVIVQKMINQLFFFKTTSNSFSYTGPVLISFNSAQYLVFAILATGTISVIFRSSVGFLQPVKHL